MKKKGNIVKRIVYGFVVQTYEDGKCVNQDFVSQEFKDDEWEDEFGEPTDDYDEVAVTYPLNMEQPNDPKIKFIVQTDKPKGCDDFFKDLLNPINLNKKGENYNG